MSRYNWIAVVVVCLVGLEQGWWDFFDLYLLANLLFLVWSWFWLNEPSSRDAPPPDRRQLREDINQAGRGDWQDMDE